MADATAGIFVPTTAGAASAAALAHAGATPGVATASREAAMSRATVTASAGSGSGSGCGAVMSCIDAATTAAVPDWLAGLTQLASADACKSHGARTRRLGGNFPVEKAVRIARRTGMTMADALAQVKATHDARTALGHTKSLISARLATVVFTEEEMMEYFSGLVCQAVSVRHFYWPRDEQNLQCVVSHLLDGSAIPEYRAAKIMTVPYSELDLCDRLAIKRYVLTVRYRSRFVAYFRERVAEHWARRAAEYAEVQRKAEVERLQRIAEYKRKDEQRAAEALAAEKRKAEQQMIDQLIEEGFIDEW